jgi:monoamine oxidase
MRSAIGDLGVGLIETVWLEFDSPFWETDAVGWSLVGTDALITQWVNLAPVTGEAVLVGLVGGSAAEKFAGLDDDDLTAAALESLAPFAAG